MLPDTQRDLLVVAEILEGKRPAPIDNVVFNMNYALEKLTKGTVHGWRKPQLWSLPNQQSVPECGTVACIAGFLGLVRGYGYLDISVFHTTTLFGDPDPVLHKLFGDPDPVLHNLVYPDYPDSWDTIPPAAAARAIRNVLDPAIREPRWAEIMATVSP